MGYVPVLYLNLFFIAKISLRYPLTTYIPSREIMGYFRDFFGTADYMQSVSSVISGYMAGKIASGKIFHGNCSQVK